MMQAQCVGLGDLQSRRQVTHSRFFPQENPAIVGHNDVAVVQPDKVVLVCMGSTCGRCTLPVQLTIPILSPVQGAPG